jgi:hypothetical protein
MTNTKAGRTYTREQIRRAMENLVRKGLAIKRSAPERGTVYVAIEFATDQELIAARARYSEIV